MDINGIDQHLPNYKKDFKNEKSYIINTMQKHKIGYIKVNFTNATIERLVDWSKSQITKDQMFTLELNGKQEGGNVMEKAHLTLFFGLDDANLNHEEVSKFLARIKLEKLKIERVDSFSTKQPGCKIVILRINDSEKQLQGFHNQFLKFPHFSELVQDFVPHITIAFVKDDFDVKTISIEDFPELFVKDIRYCLKN